MSNKSATEQIRQRQAQRAEDILKMLPDNDMVDVRLWAKDWYEVGLETGRQRGKSDTNGIGALFGVGIGGLALALMAGGVSLWLWPWPYSAPVAPDCDERVEQAVAAAIRETVAGGARVQLPWNPTNTPGLSQLAPVEWVQISGYSCVREVRSSSFLCSPTPDSRTELPAVPVDPKTP